MMFKLINQYKKKISDLQNTLEERDYEHESRIQQMEEDSRHELREAQLKFQRIRKSAEEQVLSRLNIRLTGRNNI